MSWPFDPWHAWRRRPGPTSRPEQAWLDVWREATRWWVEPVLRGAQDAASLNERLLGDLMDGLIARFEGQPVDLVVGGRRMRVVLELIRLRARGGRFEGWLELRDVEWAGWAFEQLSARAASVRIQPVLTGAMRIDPVPAARVTASDIEIAGRTAFEPFVAWVDGQIPGWRLRADAEAQVQGQREGTRMAVVVAPAVEEHQLELELRAIVWRGWRVTVPRWLRLTRSLVLPSLPHGITVRDARRRAGGVEFRATLPVIDQRFEPGQLRDAIVRGGPLSFEPA